MRKLKTLAARVAQSNVARGLAAVGTLAAANAHAAGVTVDTSDITAAVTTVASVGTAVFAVYIGVKVYKWVRSAL